MEIALPLLCIGAVVGLVLGYHKFMHSWVQPWLKSQVKDMQDIEDYANRREGRDRDDQ